MEGVTRSEARSLGRHGVCARRISGRWTQDGPESTPTRRGRRRRVAAEHGSPSRAGRVEGRAREGRRSRRAPGGSGRSWWARSSGRRGEGAPRSEGRRGHRTRTSASGARLVPPVVNREAAEWHKHPGLGPSQIRNQLRRAGIKVAVHTVRRVMEDAGLQCLGSIEATGAPRGRGSWSWSWSCACACAKTRPVEGSGREARYEPRRRATP